MKALFENARIGDVIVENPKSKLKVRDSISGGQYPFFSSGTKISSYDESLCDGKNLFIATGGKALVQYYEGKVAYSTDCYSITTKPSVIPKFLFYFLESMLSVIAEQMFEGAALRHLQKNKFRDIVMPVPSIIEQQRIVTLLDKALEDITMVKVKTKKNVQNGLNIYASVLENFLKNSADTSPTVDLAEVINILTDYHANGSYVILKKNVELKDTEDFAWMVRSTDFENDFQNKKRYITKDAYDFLAKSRILGGEIIMSKIGNAGKVYLMPSITRPCSLAMNLFLIRLDENKVSNKYVYRYLKSNSGEAQIHSKLNGTATQTITKESVRTLKIPLLPKKDQNAFVTKLEKVEAETQRLISIYQRKLAAMDALRESLLYQVFTNTPLTTELAV